MDETTAAINESDQSSFKSIATQNSTPKIQENPMAGLSEDQTVDAINRMINETYELPPNAILSTRATYNDEQQCYYIHRPSDARGSTEEENIIDEITKNPGRRLSDEELTRVMRDQKNIYKVHLNIPPEKRWAFLKDLITAKKITDKIVWGIRRQQGPSSERIENTELKAAGAPLIGLSTFKFSGFEASSDPTNPEQRPDFIFLFLPYKWS